MLGNNDSSTTCISYASDPASRALRAVELEVASDARHNLRDYWKLLSGVPPVTIKRGLKIFVGGLPVFHDDTEAVLQLCRIFLLEGFDIRGIQIVRTPTSPFTSPSLNSHFFFFVDLMHVDDVDHAIRKLDGAVRLEKELMVSRVGLPNADELVVGPLVGYQPRRKQVLEVRKMFAGLEVGEISLFYELETNPPAPGEDLFENIVQQQLYFCYVRLAASENVDKVINDLDYSVWAGREMFVRRSDITPENIIAQSESSL